MRRGWNLSEVSKAIKFDSGKAKARYFYWDALSSLAGRPENIIGEIYMDRLIKSLQLERYVLSKVLLQDIAVSLHKSLKEGGDLAPSLGVTKASTLGAEKYGHFNYQKGFNWSQPIDALGRHMLQYLDGQKMDEESGLDHRYHMLANIYMLAYHIDKNIGTNDLLAQETKDENN